MLRPTCRARAPYRRSSGSLSAPAAGERDRPRDARAAAPSPRRRTPARSPAARTRSASPARRPRYGIRWIVTSVSVKPSAVCRVSIVPTRARSDSSAIDAENCAESATMLMPQTRHSATSQTGSPPNRSPTVAAQLPLTAIARDRERRAPEPVGEEARRRRSRSRRRRSSRTPRASPPAARRPAAASARSSRRGTRRSTPTSRRAPTCGRDSRGWRAAAARRARPSSTTRGSKRGAGARFGPTPAKPISDGGDERARRRERRAGSASRRRRAR